MISEFILLEFVDLMSNSHYEQHVSFVKSHWPEIGRYVDHPLGEWFYRRMEMKPWRSRYRARSSASLLLLLILLFLVNILGLVLFFILRSVLRSRRSYRYMAQPAAYVNGRERALLPEIWLTGICFRDLAAVEVLMSIATPWREAVWWLGQSIWALIPLIVLWTVFIENSIPFSGIAAALASSATVFWVLLYSFINNRDRVAQSAIRDLLQDIRERHEGRARTISRQFTKACIGCMGLVLLFFMFFIVAHEPTLLMWLLIFLFVSGSFFIPFYVFKIMPQKTQVLFWTNWESGEEYYSKAIWSECESDLALQRKT